MRTLNATTWRYSGKAGQVECGRNVASRLTDRGEAVFPDACIDWTSDHFCKVRNYYAERLDRLVPAGRGGNPLVRITDKRLDNFRHLELINILFPDARIIQACRDPVDSCLSCFSLLFQETFFSYDLAELGRRHKAYQTLMQYWSDVLPDHAILDVQYERMVADTEAEVRRMLEYCGLDWDPGCLNFFRNPRPVHTASATQVRQPIYTKSVGRWRPRADHLAQLIAELERDELTEWVGAPE